MAIEDNRSGNQAIRQSGNQESGYQVIG